MEPFVRSFEDIDVFDLWKQIFTPEDPDREAFDDPEEMDDQKSFEITTTNSYAEILVLQMPEKNSNY